MLKSLIDDTGFVVFALSLLFLAIFLMMRSIMLYSDEFKPLLEYKEELEVKRLKKRRRSFDIIDREKILDQLLEEESEEFSQ